MKIRWKGWLGLLVTGMFMLLLSIPVLKAQTPEGEGEASELEITEDENQSLLINDNILPEDIAQAMIEALLRTPYQSNGPTEKWLILDGTVTEEWAIAIVELIDEKDHERVLSDLFHLLARYDSLEGWQSISMYDQQWNEWLNDAPTSLVSEEFKSYLFNQQRTLSSPSLANSVTHYFPWTCNQTGRVNRGYHQNEYVTDFGLYGGDVTASADGQVIYAKWNSNIQCQCEAWVDGSCTNWHMPRKPSQSCSWKYANRVKIRHSDGTTSVYLHFAYNTVPQKFRKNYSTSPPEAVNHGEKIGTEGTTGWSTGPHLHFGLYSGYSSIPYTIKNGAETIHSDNITGGKTYTSKNCNVESTSPETIISSGPSGWTPGGANLTWTGTDNVTPPQNLVYHHKLDGVGNWSGWTGATSKSYSASQIPHGWHTFRVQAKDEAGNKDRTPAERKFGVDFKSPSTPRISVSGAGCELGQNGRWQNSCRDIAFGWSATDNDSGVQGYLYYWGGASNANPTIWTTAGSYNPGAIADADGFAKSYLHVKARDNVDNESSKATFALWYDGTTPDVAFEINNGADTTSLTTVQLNLNASDTGSGVEAVRVSNNNIDWSDWLPYAETLSWNIPTLNQHTYTVYVQVHDKAGNISNLATDTIYLELYPPMPHSENFRICQDVLNNGGSAALGSSSFGLSSSIGEPLATGANASTSASFIHEGGFLANTVGCLPIVDVTTGYNMTHSVIASGGSLRSSSSFQIGDTIGQPVASGATALSSSSFNLESGFWAGDSSSSTASSLEVGTVGDARGQQALVMPQSDLSAPTINQSLVYTEQLFAVTINDGAEYTNNRFVTLQLEAPNATEMRISASEEMTDTAWQSYQMTMTWALSDSTELLMPQTVYVEFKDAAQDVYGPYLAEIIYDPNPPEGYMSILGNDTSNAIELYLEAWDDNSGVTEVGIADNPEMNNASWQPYTETVAWEMNEPNVYVQFKDQTGNISETYIDGYQEPPMSTMVISVTQQGRPPAPDPRLSVPLDVSLTIPGEITPTYVFTPTTDNSGVFTLTNIVSNTYEIRVKKSTTLQNMLPVTLMTATNTIDLGVLREGDANDDNFVTIIDFSILAAAFGVCEGTDGYDERADFNGDGCITILDFSLLASNFGQSGQAQRAPMTPNRGSEVSLSDVSMSIEPAQTSIEPGDVFNVTVRLDAGEQQVDGAQIVLNFDPEVLEVVGKREALPVPEGRREALPVQLANQVDHEGGSIQFAAGALEEFPAGDIDVVEVQFKALKSGETGLTFSVDDAMASDVTFAGASVLGEVADGIVVVSEPTAVRVQELAVPATAGWLWALLPLGMMMLAGAWIARRRR